MAQEFKTMTICKWTASFYDSSIKKWIYGVLELLPSSLKFCKSSENNQPAILKWEVSSTEIIAIEKCLSSLVFPAIKVHMNSGNKYWLSSFMNRDTTFLYLHHFFQPTLASISSNSSNETPLHEDDKLQSSRIGKELLGKVVDSKKTLKVAGCQLVEQGEQLRSSSISMMNLNNDLSVAARLTKGLKSWLPRWRIPKSHENENFFVLSKTDLPQIYSTDALYFTTPSNVEGLPCVVTVAREGLSFMHHNMQVLVFFKWVDISRLQVISLWEISATQYFIGQPDVKCNVVCVNMLYLLEEVEKYLPPKNFEYINKQVENAWKDLKSEEKKEQKQRGSEERQRQKSSLTTDRSNHDCNEGHSQLMPTDHEMANISKELSGLKSLALEIQKVEDKQLKEIDELTIAVTKGSEKLSKLNKTMKRI